LLTGDRFSCNLTQAKSSFFTGQVPSKPKKGDLGVLAEVHIGRSFAKKSARSQADKANHWREMARCWKIIGPPLQPTTEDIAFYTEAIYEWVQSNGPARVLLLGVTPELYRLPWPEGTELLAVDHTWDMIDGVWPGPKDAVCCAEWTAMPLPDASRDIVLCDGGMNLLRYPREHRQLVYVLRRLLSDHGLCILRLYVPPLQREAPEMVLRDFVQGRVSSADILKLRLGMALQKKLMSGVKLKAVWDVFHEVATGPRRLGRRIGWSAEQMHAIDIYRGCEERYCFLSVADVRDLFCESPGGFRLDSVHLPSYQLGERCPTVVLRRRAERSPG
jgi:hypothetical protein